ncbi:MAG: hypothetical protein RLZZ335_415 [Bacteroidota bacterium]|jgi:hypothetical protein
MTENGIHIYNTPSFQGQDWSVLFNLIPAIRGTKKFGKLAGGEKMYEGVFEMPYIAAEPIVLKFLDVVDELSIVQPFDWPKWDEGRKMAGDPDFEFDTVDISEKCKLLTAIIRNDRFCEGALVSAFESGLILRVLESLERQITGEKE